MKLDEILQTAQPSNFSARIALTEEQVNTAVNLGPIGHDLIVFKVRRSITGLIVFFIKNAKDQIIGQAGLQAVTLHGISGYINRQSYIVPSQQGKGYGSELFTFIWKHLKKPIFSDEAQSPAGKTLWKSISKRHQVKVINTQTGQISKRSEIPDDVLYTNDENKSADYLLMIEGTSRRILPESTASQRRIINLLPRYQDGDY